MAGKTPRKELPLSPPYEVDDWLADFDWMLRETRDVERADEPISNDRFKLKYGEQWRPRFHRVLRALEYVNQHHADFDESLLGINSKQGFAIGCLLLKALLVLYNRAAEDEVETDWPVKQVKAIARSIENDDDGTN